MGAYEQAVLHGDDLLQCQRLGADIWLIFSGDQKRGAFTPQASLAWQQALQAIAESHARHPAATLQIQIGNAAGADVDHPLESLHAVNDILERLWTLHTQGVRLHVTIDEGCYGGAAILLATCADAFTLGEQSTLSVLGPRVLKALDTDTPWPASVPGVDIVGNEQLHIHRIAYRG